MDIMSKNFYRFQATMAQALSLDSYSDDNIDELKAYGLNITLTEGPRIQEAMTKVIDSKMSRNKIPKKKCEWK